MGGLGELEPGALGDEHERVEEPGGQQHVVVEEQQPVEAGRRVGVERRAQVGPLARARGRRVEVQRDVVARAPQLRRRRVRDPRELRPRDAGHEHAARRRGGGGAPDGAPRAGGADVGGAVARGRRRATRGGPSVPERPER